MEKVKKIGEWALTCILIAIPIYTLIGTCERVNEIKKRVPIEIESRGWKILRYEGYQYGAWSDRGGRVWYHVIDVKNPSAQYRVYVTL